MILHVDMDAFFASVEQAVNPRLKGRPLIVGSRNSRLHTVVCAASYEAKARGIDSGMPTKDAFDLCPDLEFIAADQGKYIWTSEQIFGLLKNYGFEVVYASIDEFQMDLSDHVRLRELAKDIQRQIQKNFNITASIGIAKNCILAKLASKLNKPNGISILESDNLEAVLAKTPVRKLCGVGEKTGYLLVGLGLETCLDLYRASEKFLRQNLGQNGLNFYEALHSNDRFDTAINETQKIKSIGHSYTLSFASENTGFIKAWIRLLSEMVARRLREQNTASKTIHLWLNSPETANLSAQKAYKEPTSDGFEIYLRAVKIMATISKKLLKVRAIGVTCSNFSPDHQIYLFKKESSRRDLIKAVDCINNRCGEWTIYPAVLALTNPNIKKELPKISCIKKQ